MDGKNSVSIESCSAVLRIVATEAPQRQAVAANDRAVPFARGRIRASFQSNIINATILHTLQMARVAYTPLWCLLIVHAVVHADLPGCADRFEVHRDKIIRTEDSKKLGAKFIDSVGQRNRFECLELCCRTARCDVFVFEEKVIILI